MSVKNVSVKTRMGAGMKIEALARTHALVIDQPAGAGGTDSGPTPLEYYEFALGGCICTIARIVAKQRGITMRGIEVTVSGELDTDVLLGRNQSTRSGFQSFTMSVEIDADIDLEQKKELIAEVEARCPVSENTSNPTPVHIEVK